MSDVQHPSAGELVPPGEPALGCDFNPPEVRGELIKLVAAARMLGKRASTLRGWVRTKTSPIGYRRIKGEYLFDSADVLEYRDRWYTAGREA